MLLAGYGLITLVAATTTVRVRRPTSSTAATPTGSSRALRIRPSLFRRDRLREVTGFSVYASVIDWANKLNYELDEVVIGVFLGSGAGGGLGRRPSGSSPARSGSPTS